MERKMELRGFDARLGRDEINRRQMVQRLAGAMGAGLVIPGVAVSHPMHEILTSESTLAAAEEKAVAANWSPEFLDPHQNETLIALAERIIPGSAGAQVNRFIDLLLTVDSEENRRKFLASLNAFEGEAINQHHMPFKDLTEEQQHAVLTAASTGKSGGVNSGDWLSFSIPSEGGATVVQITLRDHFENMKAWVLGAYYSSEPGMKELGWTGQVMWGNYPGCEHPEGHR